MNTKFSLSLLSLILASSASAQMSTILPGGRGNIYLGNAINLPGPTANIVISPRISLPAPLLSPTIALTLAPVPMAAYAVIPVLPISLPAAIPAIRVTAERENVAFPSALRARFAAPSKDAAPAKDVVAAREKLENLFDGRKQPAEKSSVDDLGPIRSDRHHSLPENDLEKEIGAY